ncbi:hypothetical protein ACWD6N_03700 [Micromonospora sp. NPDC005163]
MAVNRMKTRDGVLVDVLDTDGQVTVVALGDGRAELAVLAARGTFPTRVVVGPDEARALAAELLRIGGA